MLRRMLRVSLALSAALAVSAALAEATLTLEQARKLALERYPTQPAAWLRRRWPAPGFRPGMRRAPRRWCARCRRSSGEGSRPPPSRSPRGAARSPRSTPRGSFSANPRTACSSSPCRRSGRGETLGRWTDGAKVTPAAAAPQWRNPPPLAQLQARLEGAALREARSAYSEWRRSGERLANYDARILPDAQARIDALGGAYAAGRSDLGPLLEARRALIESRMRRLEIEVAQARARATLEHYEKKD